MRAVWPAGAEAAASDLAGPRGLQLPESPRVSADGRTLWFVDITAQQLWRVPIARLHDRAAYESRELPGEPGFVAPDAHADGVVTVGLPDGLYRFDWVSGEAQLACALPAAEVPVRINDGAVAADGAVWFGTMNLRAEDPPAGVLYRAAGGEVDALDAPVGCWNGIGWRPDGGETYVTDTLGGEIRCYSAHGEPLGRFPVPGADGSVLPDGLLVDDSGALWSAMWGGGAVLRLRDGRAVGAIRVPGARPSALAELPDGGLVITRAADDAGDGALAVVSAVDVARVRAAEGAPASR